MALQILRKTFHPLKMRSYFITQLTLEKTLIYSNLEHAHKNTPKEGIEEITIKELKAFIGLLLLAGLLGKTKTDLKCLWRRSP